MNSAHEEEIQLGHTVSLHPFAVIAVTPQRCRPDPVLVDQLIRGITCGWGGYGFYVLDNAGNRQRMTALGYSAAQQARYITGRF